MKVLARVMLIALPIVAIAIVFAAPVVSEEPVSDLALPPDDVEISEAATPPPDCPVSWRQVSLKCQPKAEGVATGNYGGTDFFLVCGDDDVRICTDTSAWRYIMEGVSRAGIKG